MNVQWKVRFIEGEARRVHEPGEVENLPKKEAERRIGQGLAVKVEPLRFEALEVDERALLEEAFAHRAEWRQVQLGIAAAAG